LERLRREGTIHWADVGSTDANTLSRLTKKKLVTSHHNYRGSDYWSLSEQEQGMSMREVRIHTEQDVLDIIERNKDKQYTYTSMDDVGRRLIGFFNEEEGIWYCMSLVDIVKIHTGTALSTLFGTPQRRIDMAKIMTQGETPS